MTEAASYAFGAKIEANYQSTGKWYSGTIMGIRDDGKFDILYDDGDGESEVTIDRIRDAQSASAENPAPEQKASAEQTASAVPEATSKSAFAVGATIQVRKGKDWKAGQISEIDEELGSAVVEYSNGEKEKGVPLQSIRKFQSEPKKSKRKKKKEGGSSKKLNECVEVLSRFNESELDAALKMLEALDSVRATNIQIAQNQ